MIGEGPPLGSATITTKEVALKAVPLPSSLLSAERVLVCPTGVGRIAVLDWVVLPAAYWADLEASGRFLENQEPAATARIGGAHRWMVAI